MSDWILTIAPVFGLATNVIVQALCAHVVKRLGVSIIAGFLGGLAVSITIAAYASPLPGAWLTSAITFIALGFGYWSFLNLNVTSLRIRILRELLALPSLSRESLAQQYNADEFLRRRLARLIAGNQARRDGDAIVLESPLLKTISGITRFARWVILPVESHPRV